MRELDYSTSPTRDDEIDFGIPGWNEDQMIGLVLAVSSSIFIGSSFIIKKRGLRMAGANGVRAGGTHMFAPKPFKLFYVYKCNILSAHHDCIQYHLTSDRTCALAVNSVHAHV